MRASQNEYIEIVRELIKNGADVNAKNNDKKRINKDLQH